MVMIRLGGDPAGEAPAAVALEGAALLAPSDPLEVPLVKRENAAISKYRGECPTFVGMGGQSV